MYHFKIQHDVDDTNCFDKTVNHTILHDIHAWNTNRKPIKTEHLNIAETKPKQQIIDGKNGERICNRQNYNHLHCIHHSVKNRLMNHKITLLLQFDTKFL